MAQTLSKRKQQKKINIQSEKDLLCRSVVEMYCRSRWTEMKNVTIRNCQKKVINYSYRGMLFGTNEIFRGNQPLNIVHLKVNVNVVNYIDSFLHLASSTSYKTLNNNE